MGIKQKAIGEDVPPGLTALRSRSGGAAELLEAMPDGREGIEFFVRLIRQDAASLVSGKPGDLANAVFDICRFVGTRRQFYEMMVEKIRSDPSILQNAINGVRELLEAAADGEQFNYDLTKGVRLELDGAKLKGGNARSAFMFASKAFVEGTVMCVFLRMQNLEVARLSRCHDLNCRKVFFARRLGQRYCSHACANAMAVRRFREARREKPDERVKKGEKAPRGKGSKTLQARSEEL